MIEANETSNTISIETGLLQEGIGISVLELKHMSPDSNKVYSNTFGKFYTLSALDVSKLNEILVKINFNKQSVMKMILLKLSLKIKTLSEECHYNKRR